MIGDSLDNATTSEQRPQVLARRPEDVDATDNQSLQDGHIHGLQGGGVGAVWVVPWSPVVQELGE